jgi:hypothetical protein
VIPHKVNIKLLISAVIGIILYFSSNVIMGLMQDSSLESDLKSPSVTKEAAQMAALQFASKNLGFPATKAEALFESDKYANGYKVKNHLDDEYNKQFADKLPLDYWMVIASNATGESIRLKVSMDRPEVTGWDKLETLPERHDDKGLTIAMKALKDGGYNPDDWTYIPHGTTDKANRFTFHSKTGALGEAPLAVTIGIKNGEPVSFQPHFKIPDSYLDWIKSQERLAQWMTGGFLFFTAAMGITALVLTIVYRKQVGWTRGILLTVVFFILYLLQNFNVSDAMLSAQGVDTNTEPVVSIIMNFIVVLLGFLMAVAVWFSLLSGEQQWRQMGYRLWPRWKDADFGRDVFYSMGRGYLICFFILGVQQVVFLLAGLTFDAFSISDPSQSTINMRWAYLFPATAWVAAIMEEAIYRLFGVAVFKRILRYNFPALLISSIIWGLGHTGYTIYPSYTRLLEVTLLGLIFGYVFLKYGFMTAVFAHAIMDSLLMALYLMMEEPSAAHVAWGIFYIVLPAIIGYVIRYAHPGGRENPEYPPPRPAEPRLAP